MKVAVRIVLALLAAAAALGQSAPSSDVFIQNAEQVLRREYGSPGVSYALLNIRTGETINSGWEAWNKPISEGSLVKPFTAIAYAESHNFRYPEQTCAGGSACWYPAGHGKLDIVRAIALSCNSYFAQLAAQVSAADVVSVARRYGLSGPSLAASPDALAGRYGEWRESPKNLLHAYAILLARSSQPGVRDIVLGMAESARGGTAEAASRAVPKLKLLAKTGTAPCTHARHAPGDGFALVAWPADTPHYILLVRQHGAAGAQAAALAGKMVKSLEHQP